MAVVGKGMLKNNALLPQLLKRPVVRWYPWHILFKSSKAARSGNTNSATNDTATIKNNLPTTFAGWGIKKSYRRALRAAKLTGVDTLSIEDGFLRSITSGINSRYACSIVVDELGIYFDTQRPSTLENLIIKNQYNWSVPKQQRAQYCIDEICAYHLSKYNQSVSCINLSQIKSADEHILVVDQVKGDASIVGAGLKSHRQSQKQFLRMLQRACRKHPSAHIWIKAHPAAKVGYLNRFTIEKKLHQTDLARISIIDTQVNPIKLLAQVSHVYTVSSHMGFEALLLNKKVHCFGVAWYAGWELTDDSHTPKKLYKKVKKRRQQIYSKQAPTISRSAPSPSISQLFHAAYIDYSRYADPASMQSCEIEQVIKWLHTNRAWYVDLPKQLTVYEFSRWKLPFVRDFLNLITTLAEAKLTIKPKPRLKNLLDPRRYLTDYQQDFLVWGLASRRKLEHKLSNVSNLSALRNSKPRNSKIWCMEDGFIRSNGLGATLLPPLSVVLDRQGIYYDATHTSDLEAMLQQCEDLLFTEKLRVERLQQRLRKARVSKYHIGREQKLEIPQSMNQPIKRSSNKALSKTVCNELAHKDRIDTILIVGQVEDDLSVQNCASDITTNASLIKLVRELNPKAYLIYKPHPDVEAGLRTGKVDTATLKLVDQVAINIAMPACLDAVDSIHTISSLTGFEALLRGKQVTCYGLPFYAGWGLTCDLNPKKRDRSDIMARRHRKYPLTLEQLVHCVLIRYPMYRLPHGHGLAQVEQVIDYLYDSEARLEGDISKIGSIGSKFNLKPQNLFKESTKRTITKKFMQARHWFLSFTRG